MKLKQLGSRTDQVERNVSTHGNTDFKYSIVVMLYVPRPENVAVSSRLFGALFCFCMAPQPAWRVTKYCPPRVPWLKSLPRHVKHWLYSECQTCGLTATYLKVRSITSVEIASMQLLSPFGMTPRCTLSCWTDRLSKSKDGTRYSLNP